MAININDQYDQLSTTSGLLTQTDTGGLVVAAGNNVANKPAPSGKNGLIRYNTDTNVFEVVIAGVYYTLAAVASGQSPFLTGFLPITGSAPMTGTLGIVAGSSSSPGLYIANNGSTGTGLYSSSTNTLGLSTSGNSALFIDAGGHVGIGTTSNVYQLSVVQAGNSQAYFGSTGAYASIINIDNAAGGQQSVINFSDVGNEKWQIGKDTSVGSNGFYIYDNVGTKTFLRATTGGALTLGAAQNFSIDQSGNVTTITQAVGDSSTKIATTAFVSQNGVPSGTVITFAGPSAPTGYLECNGAALNTTTYATLFAAIGYYYGGSGASFNLPDMRGIFARGWDHGRGIDAGRAIGSTQLASLLTADHDNDSVDTPDLNTAVSSWQWDTVSPANYPNTMVSYVQTANHSAATGGAMGGARPINVAMMYCIKI
jgi:microcystin-dependent protein